jgi:signal transduction histidine kinase/CheY-like chemotaxis protein
MAPAHERDVRAALAEMVFERSRSSNLLGVPVGVLIAWLLWGEVSGLAIAVWLALKCTVTAWRVQLVRAYDRAGPQQVPTLERRFIVALAADGLVFGLLGSWLLPASDPVMEMVLVATLLGIASTALVVLAPHFVASLAITVPVLLPGMVVQFAQGDKVSLFVGAGMAIFLGLVLVEGRRASRHTADMLRLKFGADELAEQRRAALAEAERSNAVKGRFLATMSHEMRTPLHGILGLSALLQQEDGGGAELRRQRLRTLHDTGEHLLALINDVLDYSRIESGHLRLQPQAFDLHATLRQCAELATVQAQVKGLAMRLELTLPAPFPVLADEGRLRQVLVNLLGNAIKFTPQGHVRFSAHGAAGQPIRLSVADTGPGVPEADRLRVFEAFEQLDGSFARRHGGTGLGLSISMELVKAMGGTLRCTPAPEGGALFEIDLPLAAAPPAAPVAQAANPELVPPRRRKGHVLMAEDNAVNALVATAALERLGRTVQAVTDGQAALDELQRQHERYDIVLMDCQMPGMDGFEATRRLREWEGARGLMRLPVLALTANALEGDRQRCLDAGIDEHLAKPFVLADLEAALGRLAATPADPAPERR